MKVEEDQVLQFNLIQYTSDKDKETLVFTIVSGVGELDGSTYKYKPENTEGTESVTLRVTNSEGKYAEDTFEIAIEIDIEEILYNNLKETPFITGGLISNQFVRQIHPEMIIYLKTSTTRYAYLQIKSCLDDLEFKYRVFDEDGSISATGIRHLIIDEEYDLDGDDVPELAWLTSNRYIVQTVEFFTMQSDENIETRYLDFPFYRESKKGTLFWVEEIVDNGVFIVYPDSEKLVVSSENYEISDVVDVSNNVIAYKLTSDFPMLHEGDVIVDTQSQIIRKLSDEPIYRGTEVIYFTVVGQLEDVFEVLSFSQSKPVGEPISQNKESFDPSGSFPVGDLKFEFDINGNAVIIPNVEVGGSIEGYIKLGLGICVEIDISGDEKHFKSFVEGSIEVKVTEDIAIKGETETKISEIPVGGIDLPPFWIGPVFIVPRFQTGLVTKVKLEGKAGLRSETTLEGKMKFGIDLENNSDPKWIVEFPLDTEVSDFEPFLAGELECATGIQGEFMLSIMKLGGFTTAVRILCPKAKLSTVFRQGDPDTENLFNWKHMDVEFKANVGAAVELEAAFKEDALRFLGIKFKVSLKPLVVFDRTILELTIDKPRTPSGMAFNNLGNGNIEGLFEDESSIEDGYEVWRKKEGESEFTCIEENLSKNATSFPDNNLEINVQYTYKIRAFSKMKIEISNIDFVPLRMYSDYIELTVILLPGELPPVVPFNPSPDLGAENICLAPNLSWDCYDPSGGTPYYQIYFGKGGLGAEPVGTTAGTKVWSPGTLEPSSWYYWKVVAQGKYGITEGKEWRFKTGTAMNNPPELPEFYFPIDGATEQSINVVLSWQCTDQDNDALEYDVLLGVNNPPENTIASGITERSFALANLNLGTTYFWQVKVNDGKGNIIFGPIWSFRTASGSGLAPAKPSNPDPADYSKGNPLSLTLSWDCSDPNGDPLTYDVLLERYYSTNPDDPETVVAKGIASKSLSLEQLPEYSSYVWRVIAYDNNGNMTKGPVWHFMVGATPNNPPVAPIEISPKNNSVGQSNRIVLLWSCTDPEDDPITYEIYFGETVNPPRMEDVLNDSVNEYIVPYELDYGTQYYWRIVAKDNPSKGDQLTTIGSLWTFKTAEQGTPGTTKWVAHLSGDLNLYSVPAVREDGTIVVAGGRDRPRNPCDCDSRLYCLSTNGDVIWTYEASSCIIGDPLINDDGAIYIATLDGIIHCVEPNGEPRWKFETDGNSYEPMALGPDGTLYVPFMDSMEKVYAFYPDGEKKWEFFTDERVTSGVSVGQDGTIYFGARWHLFALNPDGTLKWAFSTGEEVASTPAIGSDGTVYFGSADGHLYALTSNGQKKWAYDFADEWIEITGPAIDSSGNIYVNVDESVFCITPSGKRKWVHSGDAYCWYVPAIGEDNLVYASAVWLLTLDSNGNQVSYSQYRVASDPTIIDDGTLLIGTLYGELVAVNVSSNGIMDSPWPKASKDLKNTGRAADPYPNMPPEPPTNPTPNDKISDQQLSVSLEWECSDPEHNFMRYDVYLDQNPSPVTKRFKAIANKSCQISDLDPETTYYWKVIAEDSYGGVSEGPVWSFTTKISEDTTIYFSEGFESGDLSKNEWIVSGDYVPFVQSSEVYEGNYSLSFLPPFTEEKSLVESEIQVSIVIPNDAFISFFRKVSGRSVDSLSFYIDGNQVGNWTSLYGYSDLHSDQKDLEWSEVVRRIPAGQHTLKWKYTSTRDSQIQGADTSWLDEIRVVDFLPLGDLVSFSDRRIEEYVRFILGKNPEESIASREVQDICSLVIKGSIEEDFGIESLEFDKTNGFVVSADNTPLNFSGFEYLNDLLILYVDNCPVVDVLPLKNCQQLSLLFLSGTGVNITDSSPLGLMNNLEVLSILDGAIDLTGLSVSSTIDSLLINSGCVKGLGTLGSLRTLADLGLIDCDLYDTSFVKDLESLKWLNIAYNNIAEINSLVNLVNLEHLSVFENEISDISTLLDNPGINSGDVIDLRYNMLDISEDSTDMKHIKALSDRGVEVLFSPQNTNASPTATIVEGPSGTISENSGTFTWTGEDSDGEIVKYEYRKDGGDWIDHGLNTSYTWSGYSEGSHTFEVRAQDDDAAYSESAMCGFAYSIRWVFVESGNFIMGDTWGDGLEEELPVHEVTLTYDLYVWKYEVTFDEYDEFCEDTGRTKPGDNGWGRGKRPVINVTWWDGVAFCNWLSEKEGLPKAYENLGNYLLDANGNITTDITEVVGYRLLTEAEWEYAVRGGKESVGYKYSGSNTASDVAWYTEDQLEEKTQEVGTKSPNELGIYDMSGNVWEFCYDSWYDYTEDPQINPCNFVPSWTRIGRGGCFRSGIRSLTVSHRYSIHPTYEGCDTGFRIARIAEVVQNLPPVIPYDPYPADDSE